MTSCTCRLRDASRSRFEDDDFGPSEDDLEDEDESAGLIHEGPARPPGRRGDRPRTRRGNPPRDRGDRRTGTRDGPARARRSPAPTRRRTAEGPAEATSAADREARRARGLHQAADPGRLQARRRSPGPGHQGVDRHQGADPLDLHQHPRPLPGADAGPEPRGRLAQDRRRRPAPQTPRDHAGAEPAQGPGLHRPHRGPRPHQARTGPRPGLPAAALESHPPAHPQDRKRRLRSTRSRT